MHGQQNIKICSFFEYVSIFSFIFNLIHITVAMLAAFRHSCRYVSRLRVVASQTFRLVTGWPDKPQRHVVACTRSCFVNPLNPELNPICYLLALLAHHFLHVSRIMVKSLTLRLLMSYIYIYMEHLFLMFLDHTQRRSTVGRTPLDE